MPPSNITVILSPTASRIAGSTGSGYLDITATFDVGGISVAPHIGAIVAIEKEAERKAGDIFPGFISLNAQGSQVGAGYLSANYAPFLVTPRTTGLRNTTHLEGQARLDQRLQLTKNLDGSLRANPSPTGAATGPASW